MLLESYGCQMLSWALIFCMLVSRPVHVGVAACIPRGRHPGIGSLAPLPSGGTASPETEGTKPAISAGKNKVVHFACLKRL